MKLVVFHGRGTPCTVRAYVGGDRGDVIGTLRGECACADVVLWDVT